MDNVMLTSIAVDELKHMIREAVQDALKSQGPHEHAEEKMISPAEAIKVFSPAISKVTLHTWTKSGRLKKYSIGGRVYYKRSEIIDAAKILKPYKNRP
jgi:hypothetical protein